MGKTYGVGFIGVGAISELHQLCIEEMENTELRGITDVNQSLIERRVKEWGVPVYLDVESLLKADDIDVVYVLSPVEYHAEHAIQAMRAGKHVLCEKPVAMNPEQIKEMDRVSKETGKVCFPAHNYIYHPEVIKIKKYIDDGVFGKICSAWLSFCIHHDEELASHYPGVNRQIMTHHLYTILYLLGKPKKLGCMTANLHYEKLDREDQSVIMLEMEDGAQAVLFSSFACDDETSNPFTYFVKVLGTQGGANHSWSDISFNRAIGTLGKAYTKYEEVFLYEAKYFINECIEKGKQPLSTIADAVIVQELVELAEENAGKQIVTYTPAAYTS